MLDNDPLEPKIVTQGRIIEEITHLLLSELEKNLDATGWMSATYSCRLIYMYSEAELVVTLPSGAIIGVYPPFEVADLTPRLRKIMADPESGAWFEAMWVLTANSERAVSTQVAFNYDEKPEWDTVMRPAQYAMDLEDFPRSPENTPDWLNAQVSAALREGERQRQKEEAREKRRRDQ